MKKFYKLQLLKNMGLRYVIYRTKHEIEKRLGVLERRIPFSNERYFFLTLKEWKNCKSPFSDKRLLDSGIENLGLIKENFDRLVNGELCFFNYEWKNIGKDYDWVTNPETGFKYDIHLHWSKIKDFDKTSGDIKYVWEKSRFTYFYSIIRYDFYFKEDHSQYIFSEIENWIDSNPINRGPNWRCSQEIALRLFNWSFALDFYKKSDSCSERLWNKIQNVIYWSLHHIYNHINFSRIAVRNNHAITETLILAISNYLFPFIPQTRKWAVKGRIWFEQEIAYQIYDDGSFLQFSMNYHRVVIQLLSWGLTLTEKNHEPFNDVVYEKAYKSLNFLYQCLQEENGNLPNYGSNDGALFFPFSNADYRDYRPQLNTLHKILTGIDLYPNDISIKEDGFWVVQTNQHLVKLSKPLIKQYGIIKFNIGGFYLIRENHCFTFIRCGNHKDRPAHADNLHIDVWINGVNVLKDSGTYKYNTSSEFQNYFTGTLSHNAVMVGDASQMLKGSRFIWYYWTQVVYADIKETEDAYIFEGKIRAFRQLSPNATHYRKVFKKKSDLCWVVDDQLQNLDSLNKHQIWHIDKVQPRISATIDGRAVTAEVLPSYSSSYYGQLIKENAVAFEFSDNIRTNIQF